MKRAWIAAAALALAAGMTAASEPASDAASIRPLMIGQATPADAAVQTLEGQGTTLGAALGEQPTVLVFYRGGW